MSDRVDVRDRDTGPPLRKLALFEVVGELLGRGVLEVLFAAAYLSLVITE